MNNNPAAGLLLLSLFIATAACAASDTAVLEGSVASPQIELTETHKDQAKSERSKAKEELAKAEAEIVKLCAESNIDHTESDAVKAERDRVCAAKTASEAADLKSEKAREDKARLYADSEKARAERDKVHAKVAKLSAAEEVNIDSAEAVIIRSGTGDPILGKEKSQICQGCHGLRGYSVNTLIPKLAGQYANYIAKELRNYQAGTRTHQIMTAMAASVTDEDLADIAAHFASQKKMSGGDLEANPIGKNLFLNGDVSRRILPCVNCHGSNGKGRRPWTSIFPVIGGQHKDYLRVQLNNFRSDSRTNSPVAIMNRMTNNLTDEEIEGLADYISGR